MSDQEKDAISLGKYVDHFTAEMELIIAELEKLQRDAYDISSEITEKKAAAKKNRARHNSGPSPLTYMYNMYANLNNVRGNRISLMTLLVNIKRLIADLSIKDVKVEQDVSKFAGLAAELYARISQDRDPSTEPATDKAAVLVADAIEGLDEAGETAYQDLTEDVVEMEGQYVCTDEGVILRVDDDYELLEEVSGADMNDFRIALNRDKSVRKATWISGDQELEIVEIGDEEE